MMNVNQMVTQKLIDRLKQAEETGNMKLFWVKTCIKQSKIPKTGNYKSSKQALRRYFG